MTTASTKLAEQFAASVAVPEEITLGNPLEGRHQAQAALLRLFWSKRRFVLRFTAIGLVAATLLAFAIPPQYEAITQLMPPDTQSGSGMAMLAGLTARSGSGLGDLAGSLLGTNSSGALFVGMLRSQNVQEDLVKQYNLTKIYGNQFASDARRRLDQNTSISEERRSGIIAITVTDKSPQRAAALANSYVNELNALVVELSTSSAHRERVFLEERLKTVKQDLDDASDKLAQFSSKNGTLDIQQQGKAMLDAAASLAGTLFAAQSELEGLRQTYSDNNVRVRTLSARVTELQKQVEKISGATGDTGKSNDSPIRSSTGLPYPSIRKLPLLGVEYTDLYRRAKIQGTIYELLTEQYELAKVEEAKETPSVKVLDPASIPDRKSYPPHLLIMMLGVCFAFGISVIWVLCSAQWRDMDPEDPRKAFAQEVVTTMRVPVLWGQQDAVGWRSMTRKIRSSISREQAPKAGGH
jgi:uncharacterized protein involved in exopolysaccharide biosynthesis